MQMTTMKTTAKKVKKRMTMVKRARKTAAQMLAIKDRETKMMMKRMMNLRKLKMGVLRKDRRKNEE